MMNLKTCQSLYDSENLLNQYGETERGKARATIIAAGRKLLAENRRRKLNSLAKFNPALKTFELETTSTQYAKLSSEFMDKLALFAAKNACDVIGKTVPTKASELDGNIVNDPNFLRTFADVTSEIVSPMLPVVTSNFLEQIVETYTIKPGETKSIKVKSNDIFLFDDSAEGVTSNPPQRLYNDTVTLMPRIKTATASINLFEYISNNADAGDFLAALCNGWLAYVTGIAAKTLVTATENVDMFPSALTKTTFTDSNFVSVASALQRANGGMTTVCFGDLLALRCVKPDLNSVGSFMPAVGEEWIKMGYISDYAGVPLLNIDNPVVPGTQNTTITPVIPTTNLYFVSLGAPKLIALGISSQKMTITITPDQTANNSFLFKAEVSADIVPLMGSKAGIITDVIAS